MYESKLLSGFNDSNEPNNNIWIGKDTIPFNKEQLRQLRQHNKEKERQIPEETEMNNTAVGLVWENLPDGIDHDSLKDLEGNDVALLGKYPNRLILANGKIYFGPDNKEIG